MRLIYFLTFRKLLSNMKILIFPILLLAIFLSGCVKEVVQNNKNDQVETPENFVTPQPPGAIQEEIKVGKVIQEFVGFESGKKKEQKVSFIKEIAVPIPIDNEISCVTFSPLMLIIDNESHSTGKSLPVYIFRVVTSQYFKSTEEKNMISELTDISLNINQPNEFNFGKEINDKNEQLFLILTIDESRVREYSQYYVQLKLLDNLSQSQALTTVLSVPTYEAVWMPISQAIDIKFK